MINDNNIRSVAIVLFKKVFGGGRSRAFTMETGGGIFMARFGSQRSPRPRFAFRDNLLKRIAVSKIFVRKYEKEVGKFMILSKF